MDVAESNFFWNTAIKIKARVKDVLPLRKTGQRDVHSWTWLKAVSFGTLQSRPKVQLGSKMCCAQKESWPWRAWTSASKRRCWSRGWSTAGPWGGRAAASTTAAAAAAAAADAAVAVAAAAAAAAGAAAAAASPATSARPECGPRSPAAGSASRTPGQPKKANPFQSPSFQHVPGNPVKLGNSHGQPDSWSDIQLPTTTKVSSRNGTLIYSIAWFLNEPKTETMISYTSFDFINYLDYCCVQLIKLQSTTIIFIQLASWSCK